MTQESESFGFDLPPGEPIPKPTAEDVLRCVLEAPPDGICPEEWRRIIGEFVGKGVVLVENPSGTVTLKAREGS